MKWMHSIGCGGKFVMTGRERDIIIDMLWHGC